MSVLGAAAALRLVFFFIIFFFIFRSFLEMRRSRQWVQRKHSPKNAQLYIILENECANGEAASCTQPGSARTSCVKGVRRSGSRPGYYHLSLLYRHIGIGISRPHIFGARANEPVVIELLDDVCGPSADARDREYRREKIFVDAEHVVSRSRVEVHVGVEFLFRPHEFLDFIRHLVPLRLSGGLAELARHDTQVRGTRVFGVIYTMAEAGNFLLLGQHVADKFDWIRLLTLDLIHDAECRLVGPAMQWAFESPDGGGDGRMHV